MPYIGTSPSNGVRRVYTYTASGSQTTFTGASNEGQTLSYVDTNYIDVYQNGVLLGTADYTSTSGTSVVLDTGATSNDIIVIIVYDVFSVADVVSKTSGGTFDGNITAGGNLTVTGTATFNGSVSGISTALDDIATGDAATTLATSAGNITIDAQGNDTDIIFKGTDNSSDITMLTLDGSDAGTAIFNHDIELGTDASIIKFGADNEITLTHVADTGLLLEDSGGTPTLQLHDSNESIASDGSKIILKSGGTTFNFPTSDGSNGQALVTNGSGTLSFAAAGASLANDANNRVTTATGSGGLNGESGLTYNGYTLVVNQPGDGSVVSFTRSGTQQGYIHIYDGGVTYNTGSDYRLKENVSDMTDATSRLKKLKPKRFNFISDETNTLRDGFLAHEVSDVVPEVVTGEKDAVDSDGNPVYQGMDHSRLVPLLVKTIQELEARIAVLESK
jgi:hypothetical protein